MLEQILATTGQVRPERWLSPLAAVPWGYRRKARLGVRYVAKKGRTLVGFRERGTSYVAELRRCDILPPQWESESRPSPSSWTASRSGSGYRSSRWGEGLCVLLLWVLEPPSVRDAARLTDFGAAHGLHFYVQEGGTETIRPLPGQDVDLYYDLPGADVRLYFQPTDFTQVNLALNGLLVEQALESLAPQPDERILDLFCGLGNFTLPIARRAAEVLGVEGDPGLVARARTNAQHNGITNARFVVADLYGTLNPQLWVS